MSEPRTRHRLGNLVPYHGYRFTDSRPFNGKYSYVGFDHSIPLVQQVTTSEGHPYQKLGKSHRQDIGGPFTTVKVEYELGSLDYTHLERPVSYGAIGAGGILIPDQAADPFRGLDLNPGVTDETMRTNIRDKAPAALSDSSLDALGARAVSRVAPTNPTVDLAVTFGEFVSEKRFFRLPGSNSGPAGEYLNYMFGIAPTLADIQDLRKAISDQEAILSQHARDSGRLVRRRYEPLEEKTSSRTVLNNRPTSVVGIGVVGSTLGTVGTLTILETTTSKWWFSGAFTYHFPVDGLARKVAELDRLYGVKPGASLAWELLPFSWLLDYKISAGDVMSNLDAFGSDGLVMPYGYVCRTFESVREYTLTGAKVHMGGSLTPLPALTAKVTSVIKQRRAANPFGFGIRPGDLSPRQLSIIAALGLTKFER